MNDEIRAQLSTGDVLALLTSIGPDEVRTATMTTSAGVACSMTALRFGNTVYGVVLDADENNVPMIVERHDTPECASESMQTAYVHLGEEYAMAAMVGLVPADGFQESHVDIAGSVPAGTWNTV